MSREASSPPARSQSSERGGSVSELSSVASERAPSSSAPSGAGEVGVARSQRTPLARSASSVASPRSSPHVQRSGELREASELWRFAPAWYPPVVPDLRIEEHGRIGELTHGRIVLVTVALALAPLPVRGQEIESVEGGHRRSRSLPMCAHVASGRGPRIATALDAYALVLGETALAVTGRGPITSTACAFPSSPGRSQ